MLTPWKAAGAWTDPNKDSHLETQEGEGLTNVLKGGGIMGESRRESVQLESFPC